MGEKQKLDSDLMRTEGDINLSENRKVWQEAI